MSESIFKAFRHKERLGEGERGKVVNKKLNFIETQERKRIWSLETK